MENIVVPVDHRMHEAVLSALDSLVTPRTSIAMRSVDNFLTCRLKSVVLDRHQRNNSGDRMAFKRQASNISNSNEILDRSDEARGNITVEEDDLLVNEGKSDREKHALHRA